MRGLRCNRQEVDTRSGIAFVGYRMVKMGDFAGAIELLKLKRMRATTRIRLALGSVLAAPCKPAAG